MDKNIPLEEVEKISFCLNYSEVKLSLVLTRNGLSEEQANKFEAHDAAIHNLLADEIITKDEFEKLFEALANKIFDVIHHL